MNKISAAIGILLIAVAAFLFLVTFSGGNFGAFAVTGTSAGANFIALVLVILLLPIGSGLAFFGLNNPCYAVTEENMVDTSGKTLAATRAVDGNSNSFTVSWLAAT